MVIPMKITSVETDGGASEGKNEITARERMRLRLVNWEFRKVTFDGDTDEMNER